VKILEEELESKDKTYEKKLRAIQQQQEQFREDYQKKAGSSRQVSDLQDEIGKMKAYYTKRIREIEDKYKFGKKRPEKDVDDRKLIEALKTQLEQTVRETQ
jgi:predicted  nucleic acid-binding Zn-ribbon protein